MRTEIGTFWDDEARLDTLIPVGRARVGGEERSEFSVRVVANLERLRDEASLTNVQVLERAGFSRNYYYTRLRLESPFTTDDVARLASVLGVEPDALTAESVGTELRQTRVDGAKLAERLKQLMDAEGEAFKFSALDEHLRSAGIAISESAWQAILDGSGPVRVPEEALAGIAAFFSIDARYLLETKFDDVADRVEAELQLKAALRDAGVDSVSFRALGGVSSNALRAVTKAIREKP